MFRFRSLVRTQGLRIDRFLKLRSVLPVLAVFATVVPSHAQAVPAHGAVGLYFNPVATRISNSTPDTGPFAFLGDNVTSRFFYGFNVGGYYDFAHTSSLDIAIDVRDSHVNGNRAILNSFLVGARVSGHLGDGRLKPYIQPFVGVGSSHAGLNARRNSRLQYGVVGGLDYSIHKKLRHPRHRGRLQPGPDHQQPAVYQRRHLPELTDHQHQRRRCLSHSVKMAVDRNRVVLLQWVRMTA